MFEPSSKPFDVQVVREVADLRKELARLTELVATRTLPDPYRLKKVGADIVVVNVSTGATSTIGIAPGATTFVPAIAPTVAGIPAGGLTGNVLAKLSGSSYSAGWTPDLAVDHVRIGAAPSFAPGYGLSIDNSYLDTTIGTATTIGFRNSSSILRVGTAGAIAATGSALGMSSSIYVGNHSQAGAEFAPLYSVLRFDQGTGFAGSGTPGRGWLTDWTVHGAIATQQQLLSGINLVMANYYNGQPSAQPSVGICLQAAQGIGGSLDATHLAATRYPNGVGYAVVGTSDGGTLRGWNIGFQAGGVGGGWNVGSSQLGTGFDGRDHDTYGLYLHNRSGSTALGVAVDQSAGNSVFGSVQVTDGTNYTEPRVAITKTNSAFGTACNLFNASMAALFSSDAMGADKGGGLALGGRTSDTGPAWRAFGYVAGRKTNGTNADSSGYLQFATGKTGVGMVEHLRIDADGIVSLPANTNVGGFFELNELTADPAAGAANTGRLYLKDNGAGKTQLCVIFNTGAVQVLATQP